MAKAAVVDHREERMSDLGAFADRFEIEALRTAFVDALARRDYDGVASLFTDDGAWRVAGVELVGREQIRAGVERRRELAGCGARSVHLGLIDLDGDTAVGRAYVADGGRGGHAVYHDRYRRTSRGWKFVERALSARLEAGPARDGRVDRREVREPLRQVA